MFMPRSPASLRKSLSFSQGKITMVVPSGFVPTGALTLQIWIEGVKIAEDCDYHLPLSARDNNSRERIPIRTALRPCPEGHPRRSQLARPRLPRGRRNT